jgi:uncharacterized protein YdeI (YjbR/CyaY-like superfamily)
MVDKFIRDAEKWQDEIAALRNVVLKVKLEETMKWRLPCYCHEDHNVAIIQPFKSSLALMFFKGTLLKDEKNILVDNGPNSQASRRLEFHSVAEIKKLTPVIKSYLKEAVAIELSGQTVKFKKRPTKLPNEMAQAFRKNARLEAAFNELTPGRQRAYILHISAAKQAATREARITRLSQRILAGKGLNDR